MQSTFSHVYTFIQDIKTEINIGLCMHAKTNNQQKVKFANCCLLRYNSASICQQHTLMWYFLKTTVFCSSLASRKDDPEKSVTLEKEGTLLILMQKNLFLGTFLIQLG